MKDTLHERYGPYPKKRGKLRTRLSESNFLKRSCSWLKWKVEKSSGMNIYHPCLQHP